MSQSNKDNQVFNKHDLFEKSSLEDDYSLGKQIGKGAYSIVRNGMHRKTGLEVAIKILNKRCVEHKSLLNATLEEIRILRHLAASCPSETGVLRLHAAYNDHGRIALVTQRCGGGDLFDKILNMAQQGRKYSEQECAKIFARLFRTLHAVHQQAHIIHNDLKHENFLLTDSTPDADIILADFGMAVTYSGNPNERIVGARNGTWGYMAPELLSRRIHSVKTDCWAMGVALYIALKASLPFDPAKIQKYGAKAILETYLPLHDHKELGISFDAASLLRGLLTPGDDQRFDCLQALAHPFLSKWSTQDTNEIPGLIPKLRRFRARQKLRAACRAVEAGSYLNRCGQLRAVMHNHDFPPMQYEKIRSVFQRVARPIYSDASSISDNKDPSTSIGTQQSVSSESSLGDKYVVNPQQFQQILKELGISGLGATKLFEIFDDDGNGTVDFKEFMCGIALFQGASEDALKTCFRILDQDSNGYLDASELEVVLRLAATGDPAHDRRLAADLSSVLGSVDSDSDGLITFAEFKRAVKEVPVLANVFLGKFQSATSVSGRNLFTKGQESYDSGRAASIGSARSSEFPGSERISNMTTDYTQYSSSSMESMPKIFAGNSDSGNESITTSFGPEATSRSSAVVITGSIHTCDAMMPCVEQLKALGIACDMKVFSPFFEDGNKLRAYCHDARDFGVNAIIVGYRESESALPGIVASLTSLPVFSTPVIRPSMPSVQEGDSVTESSMYTDTVRPLWSALQVPPGIPVCVARDPVSAALMTARALSLSNSRLTAAIEKSLAHASHYNTIGNKSDVHKQEMAARPPAAPTAPTSI